MSNSGLYSGLYSKVREYAELLDEVLLLLKRGQSSETDNSRRRLAQLLVGIEKSPQHDFTTQLLAVLVRDVDGAIVERWAELGNALLLPNVPASIIDRLEHLALKLERERSSMVASMRGRGE